MEDIAANYVNYLTVLGLFGGLATVFFVAIGRNALSRAKAITKVSGALLVAYIVALYFGVIPDELADWARLVVSTSTPMLLLGFYKVGRHPAAQK